MRTFLCCKVNIGNHGSYVLHVVYREQKNKAQSVCNSVASNLNSSVSKEKKMAKIA